MATVVDDVPGGWTRKAGPKGIDYSALFDGRVWALRRGVDFKGTPLSAQQGIYRRARQDGKVVRSRIVDDVVYVQVVKDRGKWMDGAGPFDRTVPAS